MKRKKRHVPNPIDFKATYKQLISSERLRESTSPSDRSLLEQILSDKARIVTSSSLRRLQTKAQVFSLEENAAVRTRLTHTGEVAIYGQIIAEKIAAKLVTKGHLDADLAAPFMLLVESICLLHDIGNPPFGHLGEFAVQNWYENHRDELNKLWYDEVKDPKQVTQYLDSLSCFDGNPQGFRIVTRLQWLEDEYGLNLTCSGLAGMIKYLSPLPDSAKKPHAFRKKVGYFLSEAPLIKDTWKKLGLNVDADGLPTQRHPLAFLMEAADDIAYSVSDIEDAIEKGIVSEEEFRSHIFQIDRQTAINEGVTNRYKIAKYIRTKGFYRFWPKKRRLKNPNRAKNSAFLIFKINAVRFLGDAARDTYLKFEEGLLDGSVDQSLLKLDPEADKITDMLNTFARERIYTSEEAINIELGGFRIIQDILSGFLPLIRLSTGNFERLLPGSKNPPKGGELALERRLMTLLPDKHRRVYKRCVESNGILEPIYRTQLIVDYVAGMTDTHAVKVFKIIKGTGV